MNYRGQKLELTNFQVGATYCYWTALDYNELKLAILEAISRRGSLDSNEVSNELERSNKLMIDIHAVRMALVRYYRLGLLKRERRGGTYNYSLSERGVERLKWLASQ